jgi:hypothetical protein
MKKKVQAKSNVGAPFCQKSAHKSIKNTSSLALETLNNKNKSVAHPADHGEAQFGPTQQPTNNPAALI